MRPRKRVRAAPTAPWSLMGSIVIRCLAAVGDSARDQRSHRHFDNPPTGRMERTCDRSHSARMRAAVMHAFREPLAIESVPDPEPAADGVVVAVRATGLCRSDWHGWMGHDPAISTSPCARPRVRGRGGAGRRGRARLAGRRSGHRAVRVWLRELRAVPGRRQSGLRRRVPARVHPLGIVRRAGRGGACRGQPGPAARGGEHGGRGEPRLPLRHGVPRRDGPGRLAPGEWVAVHGCGGVGLSAIMVAAAYGARVVAVDVSPAALEAASALGAEATVDATSGGGRARRARGHLRRGAPVSRRPRQRRHLPELHREPAQARPARPDRAADRRTRRALRSRWTG